MKLEGKIAVVTGSSRGIGRAIALRFVNEGAKVVINYNKSEALAKETVKEVESLGGEAIAVKADVTKGNEVKNLVKQTLERFGRIDTLVNNAGVIHRATIEEETGETWDKTMKVNLKGPFLCSKEVGKIMMTQKSGKIINISSGAGIRAQSKSFSYHVSKAGIIMLTQCLALAFAPHVMVNCVAPGFIEGGMGKTLPEETKRRLVGVIPLKRRGKPEEIAKICVFLASDDSDYVTGQTISADGGILLPYP